MIDPEKKKKECRIKHREVRYRIKFVFIYIVKDINSREDLIFNRRTNCIELFKRPVRVSTLNFYRATVIRYRYSQKNREACGSRLLRATIRCVEDDLSNLRAAR